MGAPFDQEWEARRLQEWLLLLLRYAITHDPVDRSAAIAMAGDMDSLGLRRKPTAPLFFEKTTGEVCDALQISNHHVLRKHLSRIDDPRLRRAFEAAAGFDPLHEAQTKEPNSRKRKNNDLWRGLEKKTLP